MESNEFAEVMAQLEQAGSEQTKRILTNHGAKEPFFGVKVQDLKKILKGRKNKQELAEQLYATGNSDAMYLAGLMADHKSISKETIQKWADEAYWYYISEYTVPWIAAESPYGFELAAGWIEDKQAHLQAAGWSTYSSLMTIKPQEELDEALILQLMERVSNTIHDHEPRVRFTMNNFIIAAGASSAELTEKAKALAEKIGKVEVPMPNNVNCRVPDAKAYLEKMENMGRIGKKKKAARC